MAMKFLGLDIATIAILYLARPGTHELASPWLSETLGLDRNALALLGQPSLPVAFAVLIFGMLAYAYFREK